MIPQIFFFHDNKNMQQIICSSHYDDAIMIAMASQITSLTIVYSTAYLGTDERKHQSPASLAFVRGIHRTGDRWIPRTKWPVTRKMFPFDDVIMNIHIISGCGLIHRFVSQHNQQSSKWCACQLFKMTLDNTPTYSQSGRIGNNIKEVHPFWVT